MNKIKKLFLSDKKAKYIIFIGAVGFLLIVLSGMEMFNSSASNAENEDYAKNTEEKLSNIVCRIKCKLSVNCKVPNYC